MAPLLLFGLTLSVAIRSILAASATSGTYSILSFNVAGLPAILNSNDVPGDKTTNAETIGSYFAQYDYDVIHVQEDFNYHAYIYANDDHPYRTATSGGVPLGSGLNTLANYDWVDFARVKWNTCSDASENDCLTPKGFTFMRLRLDEGVYIDFYNLHTDAGVEDGDETARTANIAQVADYIDTNSIGNAVMIFGDTNSRYSRSADNIRLFGTQNNMIDAWVELIEDGTPPAVDSTVVLCDNPSLVNTCETVDKVFYRGSKSLTLQATYFDYVSDLFLQSDGDVLSDHNPINVDFAWTLSSTLQQSDLFGGPHGSWFNDLPNIPSTSSGTNKPLKITVRGGSRLDSVALTLTSGTSYTHGGTGGTAKSLTLGTSEYWTSAKLCEGKYSDETRNFYILATTSSGNTLTTGKTTSDCSTFTAPTGWQIVGFFGQDGDEMDQLGFIYAPQ